MKILIVTYDIYPHIGGKSTHIQNLSRAFNEMNVVTEIVGYSNLNKLWLYVLLKPFYFFNKHNLFKSLSFIISDKLTQIKIKKIIQHKLAKSKIDCIIAEDVFTSSLSRQALLDLNLKIPLICTVHGDRTNETLSAKIINKDSLAAKYLLNIEISGYKNASSIVTVDNRLKNHVSGFLPERANTIKVIHNSIDVNEYRKPTDLERAASRSKLIQSELQDNIIILCPRRLTAKNGVLFAANMFLELLKENQSNKFALFFAGEGEQRKEIEEIIKKSGTKNNMVLLGDVPHNKIREYYWASDLVLVPSVPSQGVVEATSLTALEAMGCGLPVIASNIGGLAELIIHKKTGILVPPGDAIAILGAVIEITKNDSLLKFISINAREHVCKKHSHLNAAKMFLELM